MAGVALTGAVRDAIAANLASGCSLEVAALAAGVGSRTVAKWLAAGRVASDSLEAGGRLSGLSVFQRQCLELLVLEQVSRARLRVEMLAAVRKAAAEGNHHAAAWLLERVFASEFAVKPGSRARPGTGRPAGSSSAPDRVARGGDVVVVGGAPQSPARIRRVK